MKKLRFKAGDLVQFKDEIRRSRTSVSAGARLAKTRYEELILAHERVGKPSFEIDTDAVGIFVKMVNRCNACLVIFGDKELKCNVKTLQIVEVT